MSEATEAIKVSDVKVRNVMVKEFAVEQNIDDIQANTLLQIMVKKGKAKIVGQHKIEGKKGKPANIFEIPKSVTFEL